MKKIKMTIKQKLNGCVHEEIYEIANKVDGTKYAMDMIAKFNKTLRENESPRELIDVIEIEE